MPQPIVNNVATINLPAPAASGDPGFLVYVVASVQSSAAESVTITDSNATTVFSASSDGSSGGTFTVLTPTTGPTFNTSVDTDGTYTVTLTSNCAYMQSENTISLSGGYYLQQYTFITNDNGWPSGDNDFNDLCVQITCFGFTG